MCRGDAERREGPAFDSGLASLLRHLDAAPEALDALFADPSGAVSHYGLDSLAVDALVVRLRRDLMSAPSDVIQRRVASAALFGLIVRLREATAAAPPPRK